MHGAIPDRSFKLNLESAGKPSFFEITFWQDDKRFRYGFEVGDNKIVSEWLFYTPKTKEVTLFTREENAITVGASFKEASGHEEKAKDSRKLFLTQVSAANEERVLVDSVIEWFQRELTVTYGSALSDNLEMTLHYLEEHADGHYDKKFADLLRKLDIFDDFMLDPSGTLSLSHQAPFDDGAHLFDSHDHPRIIVKRKMYNGDNYLRMADFDLMRDESDGTKKLFAFAGAVIVTLELGGVLVVDELELRLHPLITKTIMDLFNSSINNRHAQLIFTTHDTNLLSNRFFRRDQIWFVEKNQRAASSLYSLAEYKPRKDATYHKDYILGKYGAIPFIGNFDLLKGKNE
jgi:hypothetical protein